MVNTVTFSPASATPEPGTLALPAGAGLTIPGFLRRHLGR